MTLLKRHLNLATAPTPQGEALLLQRLQALEAVVEVRLRGRRLLLRYDPLGIDLAQLLPIIESTGVEPDPSWLQRCRRAWYQYQDEAVCENAGAPPPSCCNKPPRKAG